MWYDIQCSKGKTNVDRKIKFRIHQKEHELMYCMAPCAGIKRCPEPRCNYICAVKARPKCPKHGQLLKRSGEQQCPVTFVYLHPVDETDPRRWIVGLVNHQKEPVCNLHSHTINPASKVSAFATALIHESQERDPSLTAQDLSIGKGSGSAVGAIDQAANHLGRVRYQLSKGKKEKSHDLFTCSVLVA